MSDIIVKSEKDDDIDVSKTLSDLTELLQEVKKEEQKTLSDVEEDTPEENNKTPDETLPESFFDDLYRDELEAARDDETTDADIQKLQEIIAKKKRILNGDVEIPEVSVRRKSRSQSPERHKRKEHAQNDENQPNESQSKRPRTTTDLPQDRNESTTSDSRPNDDTSTPQHPSAANDCEPSSVEQTTSTDPELELENLLKTEDYNSDNEEPPGISFNSNMQSMYTFPPNAMPMVPSMYNPAANQMMPNMTTGGYPMMYNMGFPPGFYPPNMMNMPMMGYGLPPMNAPQLKDETEVQCLPVVSSTSGLPKIPFKKIKLEKEKDTTLTPPAEDPKKKVIAACTRLLETMNISQSTGKFVYTSTVTKNNNMPFSNSVLQKITNVSYNFQSIGPKQNLQDWGLKGIPNGNAEIAKKISMSADKYFSKISENANTIARKLIKQEVTKDEQNRLAQEEMEVEETTLSSYFKNSMTQTEAIVCRECVARKRIVGHDIAVQACVFTGSIGSQTDPEVRFNEQLTKGLSDNQLKAMYEFSLLIREPPKNTSVELVRLREQLMNMYNLSQRQHKGYVPFIDASISHLGMGHSSARDPRMDNHPTSDPRRFAQADAQNQTVHQPPPIQTPQQFIPNYSQHAMQTVNQQVLPGQYPGRMRNNDYEHLQARPQERAMQMPNQPRNIGHPNHAGQYPVHAMPEIQDNEFAQQDSQIKRYGRGGLRR
ncbi:uncharacterized protein LOC129947757 [Eupeodes corollae]|uniref:uncharacterized protein LOC129947757 n=1 Tax=Eupeodes corollae TaxID=290404 RepID=UPI002492BCF2|nr:uncharacterized protein LOC129947757 [Eupeodes corollae]